MNIYLLNGFTLFTVKIALIYPYKSIWLFIRYIYSLINGPKHTSSLQSSIYFGPQNSSSPEAFQYKNS